MHTYITHIEILIGIYADIEYKRLEDGLKIPWSE